MRYLIIQLGSRSEVLMTTPLVRVLKTQVENSELTIVSNHNELLQGNPYIDNCMNSNELVDQDEFHFSAVIDLTNSRVSKRISKKSSRKHYMLDKLKWKEWLLINLKINHFPKKHNVDRIVELVKDLNVKEDLLGLDFFIPEKDEVERNWLPESHQNEFVVLAMSASHFTKKLPFKRLVELCDKINKPVVLVGDEKDESLAEQLTEFFEKRRINKPYEEGLEELGKKTVIFNGVGKFSFNQSASLIKQSIAVFAYDSEYMHLAAAFNKEVFTIWGNTIAEFGAFPYQTKFSIFENRNLTCRPCSTKGLDKCPLGHFKCMNESVFDFYIP